METVKKIEDKINRYKSYNQEVKDRVLKQLSNTRVTEDQTKEALKRLPMVMKANAEVVRRCRRVHKGAVKLEKHTYAPELNKLHFKTFVVSVPGKTTIKEAIEIVALKKYDEIKGKL